jgi:molybdate transport system substrate-binding protein
VSLSRFRLRAVLAIAMLVLLACVSSVPAAQAADSITIAAAADLKFAMDEIVAAFRKQQPADRIEVIYGSSGKFHAQIQQGAPFDLYFSADIAFARSLEEAGLAAGPTRPYAQGRIVLWSNSRDASRMSLEDLLDPAIDRIAIANPRHAPYGKRAEEALRSVGLWDKLRNKLVMGENIAQTAQFVQSGNAQVGIIALALALNPVLAEAGGYSLIDEQLHEPLEQGFIVTRRAEHNALAAKFADFISGAQARSIMSHYGFVLPDESTH